jgi:hypothetical protein
MTMLVPLPMGGIVCPRSVLNSISPFRELITISPTLTLSTSTLSTVPFGKFTFSILILSRRLPEASRRNSASPIGVAPLILAPVSLISIPASCPGDGEGLGDGLGDGLAVGLGLGVAVALGGVGVCHALTGEVFRKKRVRRSMLTAATPTRKFIARVLLFRKLIALNPFRLEIALPMPLAR